MNFKLIVYSVIVLSQSAPLLGFCAVSTRPKMVFFDFYRLSVNRMFLVLVGIGGVKVGKNHWQCGLSYRNIQYKIEPSTFSWRISNEYAAWNFRSRESAIDSTTPAPMSAAWHGIVKQYQTWNRVCAAAVILRLFKMCWEFFIPYHDDCTLRGANIGDAVLRLDEYW